MTYERLNGLAKIVLENNVVEKIKFGIIEIYDLKNTI
jgi:hypothetical protein